MNKQILIDDYKQTIERLQRECTEKTNMNIKLKQNANDTYEMYKALMDSFNILNKEKIKLEHKLKIAEEHLDVIARGYHFGDDIEKHLKLLAEQALQKIKEFDNE